MKTLTHAPLLWLLALASLLTACNSEQVSPKSKPSEALLIGRWEFTHTTGGIGGGTLPADPARKQELIIEANKKVKFLLNNAVTKTASYSLVQGPAINGRTETFLRYGTEAMPSIFIGQISDTELVLVENYYDGRDLHYSRR